MNRNYKITARNCCKQAWVLKNDAIGKFFREPQLAELFWMILAKSSLSASVLSVG